MQKLTKAEEELMHLIWEITPFTVAQLLDKIVAVKGGEKPPHSTISTLVRSIEDKGFLDHKAYGRTYEYFALVKKEDYSRTHIKSFLKNYFDGSPKQLVSFLVKDQDLSLDELQDLMEQLDRKTDS